MILSTLSSNHIERGSKWIEESSRGKILSHNIVVAKKKI